MAQDAVDVQGGTLQGIGNVYGVVTVDGGTIAPGNSPRPLTIDGDLTFNSGALLTEIGGTGLGRFDHAHIAGAASFLGGALEFSFIDGFLPTLGDSWDFLVADGGLSGPSNLNFDFLGAPSYYNYLVSATDTGVMINLAPVPEPEIYAMLLARLGLMRFVMRPRKVALTST